MRPNNQQSFFNSRSSGGKLPLVFAIMWKNTILVLISNVTLKTYIGKSSNTEKKNVAFRGKNMNVLYLLCVIFGSLICTKMKGFK